MEQIDIDKVCDRNKMILCYDLDDTLIDFETGEPYKDRIAEVVQRYNEGHYIIICTARRCITHRALTQIVNKHGIPYHELAIGTKPKAHIYIDDSAVNADDYFANPTKYLRIFFNVGFRINWLIRNRGANK